MANEFATFFGGIATAGAAVAQVATLGLCKEVNQATKDCADFTARKAADTSVARVAKAVADPTNADKWKSAGCGVINAIPGSGLIAEGGKMVQQMANGERVTFDAGNVLLNNGGDTVEYMIDNGRDKSHGIWVGKRPLRGPVEFSTKVANLNVYHAAIIVDGKGFSYGRGTGYTPFDHNDRDARSYQWKQITGFPVNKTPKQLQDKAGQLSKGYNVIRYNCQSFVQNMAEYACGSRMIDTGF